MILAPTASGNALGRAISLALVARELGPTRLIALDDGSLWAPASKFGLPIETVGQNFGKYLQHARALIDRDTVLWVSKGLRPLDKFVQQIRREWPNLLIIFDMDDDDAALSTEFRNRALLNRVKLNRFRRLHPKSVQTAQQLVSSAADLRTFSNPALANRYADQGPPFTVIPHVRADNGPCYRRLRSSGPIRLGVLGTMRSHKGIAMMPRLLAEFADLELVVFQGSGLSVPEQMKDRVRTLPANLPIREVYDQVDVSLIVMDEFSQGAALQLPAKLIDALEAAVPVVTTATPAIESSAGRAVNYLPQRPDPYAIYKAIKRAAANNSGAKGRVYYEHHFEPRMVAKSLSEYLESLSVFPR